TCRTTGHADSPWRLRRTLRSGVQRPSRAPRVQPRPDPERGTDTASAPAGRAPDKARTPTEGRSAFPRSARHGGPPSDGWNYPRAPHEDALRAGAATFPAALRAFRRHFPRTGRHDETLCIDP